MRFQLAEARHEPELRELYAATPLHGPIRIGERRDPDFFGSLAVQGEHTEAIVWSAPGGRIAGMGTRAVRAAWIGGREDRVGYLGGLRGRPEFRGGTGLARGYRQLRLRHEQDPRCRFYLTTIMEGNREAAAILTSGRAGLPRYLDAGPLTCAVFGAGALRTRFRPHRALAVGPAAEARLDELLDFLATQGAHTDFFPVLSRRDFGTPRLRDLAASDFLVARDRRSGAVEGAVAVWDQTAFRQFRVEGCSKLGRLLRPAARLLCGVSLPPAPRPIPLRHAAFVCVKGQDPAILAALLHAGAGTLPRGTGLVVGFPARHPLHAPLAAAARFAPVLRSRIHLVCWEDALAECTALLAAGRPFHLDPAVL